jgi:hypothetical protein
MPQYEFGCAVSAWCLCAIEANDLDEALRKFIATPIAKLEWQAIETPIHEITVTD